MTDQNWDDFRFVLAVARHGSLNAAARALGVNHATVLRRVNGFQDRYGVQVFDREASGYRLRPDQMAFAEALSSLREAFDTTERALAGQGAGVRGPVKITSTDSLCDSILPEVVAELRHRHPELSLELLATNSRLDLGQLDAEVTVRPTNTLPEELVGSRVGKLMFAVYGHPRYLDGRGAEADRWLACSGPLLRSPVGAWQQEAFGADQVTLSADSFLSLRNLCARGIGLAVLPRCIARASDGLRHVQDLPPSCTVDVWVANHRDLNDMPRIAACRSFLTDALRARADQLSGVGPQTRDQS